MVTIVIPTRNETAIIRGSISQLFAYLHTHIHEDWHVIVADNGSTDSTRAIVRDLATTEPRIELLAIPEAGKGRAVLGAWKRAADSPQPIAGSSVYVFMDADLATDLVALPPLIAAIRSGADVAI